MTAKKRRAASSVLEARLSVIGAIALRDGERLTLRLADGQLLHLTTSTAALAVTALLADGQVQQEWLHGGCR